MNAVSVISLHANSRKRQGSRTAAPACADFGPEWTEFGRGGSAGGRRSAQRAALEERLSSPRSCRTQDQACSWKTVATEQESASRPGQTSAARGRCPRIRHGSLDLSAHRGSDRATFWRSLSCRPHSSLDENPWLLLSKARTPSARTRPTDHPGLDQSRLGKAQKKARQRNAWLVFIDESGLFLIPFVRRTWAPRGRTPILKHRMRHHCRLSLIGAISISPQRRHLGWYLNFHRDRS